MSRGSPHNRPSHPTAEPSTALAHRLRRPRSVVIILALALAGLVVAGLPFRETPVSAQGGRLAVSYSSPIAITSDNNFVWVANPDNNSVSLINVTADINRKVTEITVGQEPQSVALTPDNRFLFVTNQASNTVSVIDTIQRTVVGTIPVVGSEPFGCALTADGRKLYVTNVFSDNVNVIDTSRSNFPIIQVISNVGVKPYALAVTTSGPEKVYVTQFLAQLRNDGRTVEQKEGRDDGKEGRVTVLAVGAGLAADTVVKTVVLNPIADTGFNADGSTLDRKPLTQGNAPAAGNPNTLPTGAFPNLLESVVIRGDKAYVPNVGSSPNGPFRFNVNVQGLLSVFDVNADQEVQGATINMNRGIGNELVGQRLFMTTPLAAAFKRNAAEGYVALGAVDRLVRVTLGSDGSPTVNAPTAALNAGDPDPVVRVAVGKFPRGLVINSTDTRAYVMNYISRDVSVVDIQTGSPSQNKEIARIQSADLPAPGTLAGAIQRGHELFNTGIGPAGSADRADAKPPAGRMSNFGWGSCYNCHPRGLQDGVTWMFPDGPRQTISLDTTFAHPQPATARVNANFAPVLPFADQRALNWSAVRDEVQDFELNIRAVSGGEGLIANADGTQDPCVFNLVLAAGSTCPAATAVTTGRSADLDAMAAYMAFGIRSPNAPAPTASESVAAGRVFFDRANCQFCHGGPKWTRSRIDFAPPPQNRQASETIQANQLVFFLRQVGTFDPNAPNELRANQTDNLVANGSLGFNTPSLLSVFSSAPYLHSGSAPTLADVLNNVIHRGAGTGGTDTLSSASDRSALVDYLKHIDASTPPFP